MDKVEAPLKEGLTTERGQVPGLKRRPVVVILIPILVILLLSLSLITGIRTSRPTLVFGRPRAWPVPIYSSAQYIDQEESIGPEGQISVRLSFFTTDSRATVRTFYEDKLTGEGWSLKAANLYNAETPYDQMYGLDRQITRCGLSEWDGTLEGGMNLINCIHYDYSIGVWLESDGEYWLRTGREPQAGDMMKVKITHYIDPW